MQLPHDPGGPTDGAEITETRGRHRDGSGNEPGHHEARRVVEEHELGIHSRIRRRRERNGFRASVDVFARSIARDRRTKRPFDEVVDVGQPRQSREPLGHAWSRRLSGS